MLPCDAAMLADGGSATSSLSVKAVEGVREAEHG